VKPPTPEPVKPPTPEPVKPPTPEPIKPPAPTAPGTSPDTIGMWREAAEGTIRRAGYRYQVVLKQTTDIEDGRVLSQSPAPGERLEPGGVVTIEVSRMPVAPGIPVPDVRGMKEAEALATLRGANFLVRTSYGGGTTEQQGCVINQAPAPGNEVARRSWVEIVIARGSGPTPTPTGAPVSDSGALDRPPAVGSGRPAPPPSGLPHAPRPTPAVRLPARDAPKTAVVPDVAGLEARQAISKVLSAGLIPIVEVDRSPGQTVGSITRQGPVAGTPALPGDLVRIAVSVGAGVTERSVDVPMAVGAELVQAQRMFAGSRLSVEIVEVVVPEHPYAGTARVAAQYPVSSVPRNLADRVTLWVVR
jgi:beta-lactam-binding protein with PASTA domain